MWSFKICKGEGGGKVLALESAVALHLRLPLAGTPQRLCGLHAVGPGLCAYYVCMRAAQMPSLAALYVGPGQVWAVGDLGRSPQCEPGGIIC